MKLSGLRVSVEHCIGRLKARFPSLRGLPLRIRGKRDIATSLKWIGSCVILHNLLLDLDDGVQARWTRPEGVDVDSEEEDGSEGSDMEDSEEEDVAAGSTGVRRRDMLMRAVIDEYNNEN